MSAVLATQKTEIRRIAVPSQQGKIVRETLSQKKLSIKRAGGVAQGVGPEFKPQSKKNKKSSKQIYSYKCFKDYVRNDKDSRALAHAYNSSNLGCQDREDHSSRLAWQKCS
jgi:hypothetical protein